MLLFYTPDIEGDHYTLSEEESKHCFRVLRLKEGDEIHLTDGKGKLLRAEIIDAHPKRCITQVVECFEAYEKRDFSVHIAVAPTKNNDRIEWFLEKATEIGIDQVTPVLCKHSERKQIKVDRFRRVVTAAVKQSLKAYHPEVHEMIAFDKWIKQDFVGQKFIAYCDDYIERKGLKQVYAIGEDATILIGPEGDFRPDEVELAMKNGFIPITLGTSRLRTETAALVACHTINLLNE